MTIEARGRAGEAGVQPGAGNVPVSRVGGQGVVPEVDGGQIGQT